MLLSDAVALLNFGEPSVSGLGLPTRKVAVDEMLCVLGDVQGMFKVCKKQNGVALKCRVIASQNVTV